MSNKKGVKKGSAQANLYVKRQNLERELWTMKVLAYTQQETLDAAALALNEFFGFGPERLRRFHDAFSAKYDEIHKLQKGDLVDGEYYKAKIEQALKQAWGPHYEPREYRYDFKVVTPEGGEYKL